MGNRVRELRNERGLSQEDLARWINVSQQTISRIENEKAQIPTDILIHLVKIFHVSADYILRLSDTRMADECRIVAEQEKNMDFFRIFEKLNRNNQELVGRIMRDLSENQEDVI